MLKRFRKPYYPPGTDVMLAGRVRHAYVSQACVLLVDT